MRFGKTLRNSIYKPWQSHYLDYARLKLLLREDELDEDDPTLNTSGYARQWTEEDESAFVEELLNVQLEKVNTFHVDTFKQLRDRTSECEAKLENYAAHEKSNENDNRNEEEASLLKSVEGELDK